jgi:hypothetical protein
VYRIEKLTNSHKKDDFDCGEGSLNDFLFSYAKQNAKKDLSQTYVAVDPDAVDKLVLGYYSISCGSVEFQELPDPANIPTQYPIPTVLLARLARDKSASGLGPILLLDSYRKVVEMANIAGVHVYEVDALHAAARSFYEKYDFVALEDAPLHLFQTVKDIRKVVEAMDANP